MRRTALRHALLSFLLGTFILAVTINVVAGLLKSRGASRRGSQVMTRFGRVWPSLPCRRADVCSGQAGATTRRSVHVARWSKSASAWRRGTSSRTQTDAIRQSSVRLMVMPLLLACR